MAGSYRHLRDDDGKFRFDLIDHLGDAYEACEMCFWMIDYLAGGDEDRIREAEEAYYEHLRSQWDG